MKNRQEKSRCLMNALPINITKCKKLTTVSGRRKVHKNVQNQTQDLIRSLKNSEIQFLKIF